MLVKIEARILIFPGTDFHFPSTSVPPGTFFKALVVSAGYPALLSSSYFERINDDDDEITVGTKSTLCS